MRGTDFVSEVRQATRQLWEAINTLKGFQREWNALDYGTTLESDGALIGEHAALTAAEIGAVVFDSANAMETVLNAGHATNPAKLL